MSPTLQTCIGCGCTDASSCIDPATGRYCEWVAPNICSVCADIVHAMEASQRVEGYTPFEAQRYIEETRGARLAAGGGA